LGKIKKKDVSKSSSIERGRSRSAIRKAGIESPGRFTKHQDGSIGAGGGDWPWKGGIVWAVPPDIG